MASRIEHRSAFSADLATTFDAVAGEPALRARLEQIGGDDAELLEYVPDGDGVRYKLRQGISSDKLPSAVRTLHRGDLIVEREQTWKATGAGYTGTATASVSGVPGEITAKTSLTDEGERTTLVNSGTVKVRIPFVGGKLETVIAEQVTKLLEREAEFVAKWLAER
ncbi:DUF2505 domain-containing protein [Amycolatopsis azurea]|uniref:DUF2505 domain-containing protein n=1 Tax=Amycolatopsis azurea DSM 43854 TaxID=1238180 RepID=M2QCH6_9PSEU|nr:DUF2505 domain-containing protein [Amycolatopsis azurea]EMD24421.1 hypothetical protein C791_6037 [Amycolatopsis azurea DSM 43854]OOC06995.1 hypothetical protein B0293_07910 [Amycolatopsis azurea DSM 43854]